MMARNSFVITLERDFYRLEHDTGTGNANRAAFISRSLDSRVEGMFWHRCRVDCSIPAAASLHISFFAGDYHTITYKGSRHQVDELIRSSRLDSREKESLLAGYWEHTVINGTDFPLQQLKGRYLWLKVELLTYGQRLPEITDLELDFPLKPLTEYLPEIYQQDPQASDLLNRYLGIFQSLLDELDGKIKDVNSYLDKELVDQEFLQWLCLWFDLQSMNSWPQVTLRRVLGNAYRLYRIKGTRASIAEVVELYTGERPLIVEHFEIEKYGNPLYFNLYGDNRYTFTVMVKERYFPTLQHYTELKQFIDIFKPAHTMLKLVALKPCMFLDSYVYLGVNSVLSDSGSLVLDSKAAIPFDTTLEGMEEQ